MKKTIIAIFITCLLSTSVQAAIIDSGEYFKDEATGYTWMDLKTFKYTTYDEVQSQIFGTGFQIATLSMLNELWMSTYEHTFSYLHDIMGGSIGSSMIIGMYDSERDDNLAGLAWTWNYNEKILWTIETKYNSYDDPDYDVEKDREYSWGTWLVNTSIENDEPNINTVPEPNTLLLFGAGLIALSALMRSRRS